MSHKIKMRQPLAAVASCLTVFSVGAFFTIAPAMAATNTTAATTSTQSVSPYAVLGNVGQSVSPLSFDNSYPLVGQKVNFNATGLPANTTLNLVWETYSGTWDTQAENFIGAKYTTGNEVLSHVQTDASGAASGSFTVPTGFGDVHFVGLVDSQGNVVAAGTVAVSPIATISSTTAAQGQFFHIHVEGLGRGGYTSLYEVIYDNHFLGRITGVTTNGTADFTVRAEGGVGTHTLQLVMGGMDVPYLNAAQSPYYYRPNYSFVVNVTPGHPTTMSDSLPAASPSVGSHLTASVDSGTVGQKFTLSGNGLTPNHQYQLVWNTMAGSRVSGNGYGTMQLPLGSVTTDKNGSFSESVTVPDDLGGPAHTIQLLDGTTVAGDTTFRIFPTVVSVPKAVTVGQQFTVDMKGVGWTEYDNIYAVSYDNSAIGFVCGFNTQGDVSIQLQASGTPGIHYIDLYPSIWKGTQTLPDVYGVPLLTYVKDHPGDNLPAFHLVIDVLPANSASLSVNGKAGQTFTTSTINGQTSIPLYTMMTTLKGLGVTSTWNGQTWTVHSKSVASMTGTTQSSGNFIVSLNGHTFLSGVKSVQTIPGSSIQTTFIPLSTANQVLQALGYKTSFSNGTWSWTTR